MSAISDAIHFQQRVGANKLEPLYVVREALGQTGLAARNAFIFTEDAAAARELQILAEQKSIYLAALDRLEPELGSDAQFKKAKSGLLAMAEELKRPRTYREAKQMAEFGQFLVTQCSPLRRRIVEDIDVLVKQIQREVADANSASDQLFKRSTYLIMAIAATVFVMASAISIVITRDLLRQLGGEPRYAAQIAQRIADGDLTVDVAVGDKDASSLLWTMRKMRDNLAQIVGKVRAGTEIIAAASMQIAQGNLDLSSRTEQQAGSPEETASSME